MYTQNIYQRRSDGACINKVPLPPVRSQAGAGYFVTPGLGIFDSSGMQKATCASDFPPSKPYKLTLEYNVEGSQTVLSPLSIARSFEVMFPYDNEISVLQNRINKSLLIEVYKESTYRALLNLQEINNYPVVIKPKSSVMSKGVFHCEETLDLTEKERGQLDSQGVIDLYRINHTNMYSVTFNTYHLPDKIKISCLVFKVKLHIPKPRRCFKCQRYGHTEEHCVHRRVCPSCGHEGHSFQDCKAPPKCYHCEEPHPVTSTMCPMYKLEHLVLEYGVRNHVDYNEARTVIYDLYDDLVLKVPKLRSFQNLNVTPLSPVETGIVEKLSNTIDEQQAQIALLIDDLKHIRSFIKTPEHTTLDSPSSFCENEIPHSPQNQSSPVPHNLIPVTRFSFVKTKSPPVKRCRFSSSLPDLSQILTDFPKTVPSVLTDIDHFDGDDPFVHTSCDKVSLHSYEYQSPSIADTDPLDGDVSMGNSSFEHETLYSQDDICPSIASTSNSLSDLVAFNYSASDSVSITDLSETVHDFSTLESKPLSSQSCGLSESLPNLSQVWFEWPFTEGYCSDNDNHYRNVSFLDHPSFENESLHSHSYDCHTPSTKPLSSQSCGLSESLPNLSQDRFLLWREGYTSDNDIHETIWRNFLAKQDHIDFCYRNVSFLDHSSFENESLHSHSYDYHTPSIASNSTSLTELAVLNDSSSTNAHIAMNDLSQEIDTFPEQPSHLSQGSDHSNNDSSDFITVTYDRRGRLMKPSINPDDKTLSCQSSDDAPSVKEVVTYLPAFEPSEPFFFILKSTNDIIYL